MKRDIGCRPLRRGGLGAKAYASKTSPAQGPDLYREGMEVNNTLNCKGNNYKSIPRYTN